MTSAAYSRMASGLSPCSGKPSDPDGRRADLALVGLEPFGADEGEVARRARHDRHDLAPRPALVPPRDPARRGDDLPLGEVEADRVMPRLLVPGLVPRDERGPLPAPVVVVGQHGIPVHQVGDAVVVPPAPPVVGQVERELDLGLDRPSRGHRPLQGDDHHRIDVRVEPERGRPPRHADLGDRHPPPPSVHRLVGAEPEHLQRPGEDRPVAVLHPIARIDVEDQLADRDRRAVGELHPLPRDHLPRRQVESRVHLVARQAGRDGGAQALCRWPHGLILGRSRPARTGGPCRGVSERSVASWNLGPPPSMERRARPDAGSRHPPRMLRKIAPEGHPKLTVDGRIESSHRRKRSMYLMIAVLKFRRMISLFVCKSAAGPLSKR